jgi:iron complex transport system substrate-binding protein
MAAPARVVSLIASATEIVAALGEARRLVGRSHECDFPPEVVRLPVLTQPKFAVEGLSADIDARVREIVAQGLSVYRVDADALAAVRPDLIVTQDHCEVCAVSLRDVEDAVCRVAGLDAHILSLQPDRLDDLWTGIAQVAEALAVPKQGAALTARLQERMQAIAHKAQALRPRPRVGVVEWIDPLMAGGNWMPELVAIAGGENLFGEAGRHSPTLAWEVFAAADPDVVFVQPCGFDIARTLAEMPRLAARPGWRDLRAVREGRVVVADGSQYFNRPGPRLVDSLEILAEVLHPDHFAFGHEGLGWVRFGP